ncbi:MAG: hypothetical protein QOJ94_2953 [Sphingomonadales bacterium]|jgi:hypothetical protein|nr:hypothetical protein [Sphingomonadales bacterium]
MILSLAVALGFASASSGAACSPRTAAPAAIEAVQGQFEAYDDRCVRLRGLLAAGTLYVDREVTLDPLALYGEGAKRSIVVFPSRLPKPKTAAWVEIVGKLGSCADANAWVRRLAVEEGTIAMVGGYCHTSLANYVYPLSIRRLDAKPVPRLTEAEVPPERRPLIEAPPSRASRGEHRAAARALAAAIASADEAAFLRVAHPEIRHELDKLQGGKPPRWLREDIATAHAEFQVAIRRSPLRGLGSLEGRQERILVDRESLTYAGDEPHYLVCWCREHDCTDRWPVAERDADNDPSRPYACVLTSVFALGDGGEAVSATAILPSGGFAEPAWPRPPA